MCLHTFLTVLLVDGILDGISAPCDFKGAKVCEHVGFLVLDRKTDRLA